MADSDSNPSGEQEAPNASNAPPPRPSHLPVGSEPDWPKETSSPQITTEPQASAWKEIQKLPPHSTNWRLGVVLVILAFVVFSALGMFRRTPGVVIWVIPIFLLHDFGHWLAMIIFRCRDPRLFIIPGAAFGLKQRNGVIPGWKRMLVTMAGPIPGVIIGVALAFFGVFHAELDAMTVALMMLLINGVSLLPFFGLDGGWIVQVAIYARHYWLATILRTALGILVVFLGLAWKQPILVAFGIAILSLMRLRHRLGQLAYRFRKEGTVVLPPSSNFDLMPPETAEVILNGLVQTFKRTRNPQVLAHRARAVYEMANSRPPNLPVSFLLLLLYVAGLGASVLFSTGLINFQLGRPNEGARMQRMSHHRIDCKSIERFSKGGVQPTVQSPHEVFAITFHDDKSARSIFQNSKSKIPADGFSLLVGQSVLISVPPFEASGLTNWVDQLPGDSGALRESTNRSISVLLSCQAHNATHAKNIADAVGGYLAVSAAGFQLPPPWGPANEKSEIRNPKSETPTQVAARFTFLELTELEFKLSDDPQLKAGQEKVLKSRKKHSKIDPEKTRVDYESNFQKKRAELISSLRKDGGEKLNAQMLDEYAASKKPLDEMLADPRVRSRWATLLGSANSAPTGSNKAQSAWSGDATVTENRLNFQWLVFDRITEGLPAFLEWLCSQGCTELRYGLDRGGDPRDRSPVHR